MEAHVQKTLKEFDGVKGIKHVGIQLIRDKVVLATAFVQWHTWEFQGSDESPVQDMAGYVFKWQVEGHWIKGINTNHEPENFDKDFGEAMARHL